jgi:phage gp36-like protein
MAYATAAEMEAVLGERTFLEAADRDHDGVADSSAVATALAKASSFADSYITRFLPITGDAPEALKDAVIRIAHYQLTGETGNEETRRRHDDAVAWLRDVAKGHATLGIPPSPREWVGKPEIESRPKTFDRDSLRGVL